MYFIEDHIAVEDDEKRYGIWRSDPQPMSDTYMGEDATIGEIFRAFQKMYGRCISKVYVDTENGGAKAIGWVFQKREEYEDSRRYDDYGRKLKPKTFLREVWITLLDKYEVKVEREYHEIGT